MKRFVFVIIAFIAAISLFGCGKKQQSLEEMQQPMSMETLTTMSGTTAQAPEARAPEAKVEVGTPIVVKGAKLEALPPSGPYKPTPVEIQTALKNANFYTGAIDGKIGPKTKKAVAEFQKANGLAADGRVGPKTWSVLSKYLTLESTPKAN
ncbi:MAG: peptidoglycan-binding protein [Candidatus Omnitrophica bacterium]|jgi:peptidoglycan hydrolase-like protein with peptidoglycan-binding domain|nr:peptidoglycan-binding protein [Candidatus Omnitrophota bacterium]